MLHDREMYGITRRQLPIPQDNLFRALCDRPINMQHLIHYAKKSVERRLDCVAAVDSDVTVKDLLDTLGVRNQTRAIADDFFEQWSRVALVGMGSAKQVHGNILVDQNHGCALVP